MGYGQILAQLAYKTLNTSFKPNGLGPATTSSHLQPPAAAQLRPPPATFPVDFKKKKKIMYFFLMCFYLLSFAFVFQPQCLDTLSLRGDVSVYVGLVPHW
jgi:hypothetical protein